jgi:spore coat protein CotH
MLNIIQGFQLHFVDAAKNAFQKKVFILLFAVLVSSCGGSDYLEDVPPPTPPPPPAPLPEPADPTISQFSFLVSDNPSLTEDINLDIAGKNITGRTRADADISNLIASIVHDGSQLSVSDMLQTSGTSANDFTDILSYILKAEDGSEFTYTTDITHFTGLPIIHLNTLGNADIVSKDDYIDGTVSVDGGRNFPDIAERDMEIRGRGNSTWGHPKKPYQMKMADKDEMLGMPEDKKWLFLAEYSDKTMLRNTIAFEMGHISSLDWTPKSTFAEVYLNGSYNGTYNITQKVEEDGDRVDLGDTGFLLEIDQLNRLDADDVYFYTNQFLINIKEPDVEWADEQSTYIKAHINEFETTLYSSNFADPTNGYAKYIDVDSFIDWYLISEITKNVDSKSFSSIFLNVIPGQKIKMGPLWDFDLSFGNVDYADSQYAAGFWVKFNPWFTRLFEDRVFIDKVKTRFAYFRDNQALIIEKIDSHAERLKWSQQENNEKWQTFGIYVWPNPVFFDTYDEEVEHLKTWYSERMDWLDGALNDL